MKTKEQIEEKRKEYYANYKLLHPEGVDVVSRWRRRKWVMLHRTQQTEINRKWNKNNHQKCLEYGRAWKLRNPHWRGHDRARYLEKARDWIRKHRATLKGNLNDRIGRGILRALGKNKGGYSWESVVGYTVADLKSHLEKLFCDGMSWGNMGQWHIDHIIPISFFHYEKPEDSEFQYCWSLNNLQPLWASDNCSKHKKLSTEWKGRKEPI